MGIHKHNNSKVTGKQIEKSKVLTQTSTWIVWSRDNPNQTKQSSERVRWQSMIAHSSRRRQSDHYDGDIQIYIHRYVDTQQKYIYRGSWILYQMKII